MSKSTVASRMRFTPLALTTVLLSAGLLSLSVTGTLSGFTAAITNSVNSAATGTLVMQEQNAGATVTCTSVDGSGITTNAATCSTVNEFGGTTTMVPGTPVTTTVTIRNTGTLNASTFMLTPGGTCTQTSIATPAGTATDLCTKLTLVVKQDGTQISSGTLTAFAGSAAKNLTTVAAGGTSTFTFTVTLDAAATNAYQGLQASVPMTWTFNS
ncbi:hypothetical protein [uncultured Amnibacterium sp.]|uniref:hypothetical protein n=1 Tax=uncultured Amnibacterium sp. TaxID=1631851 RepID=UPI0035CA2F1D